MRYIVKKENAETIYISGGIFVSNGKWTHPKMILDDYELVIVLKGRFQMRIGQARKEFLEGDCFIRFPGEAVRPALSLTNAAAPRIGRSWWC